MKESFRMGLACLALTLAVCSDDSDLDTDPFVPVCEAAEAAGCSDGLDKCASDWAKARMRCPTEVDEMVACAGAMPTATCTGDVALIDDCQAETSAAIACALGA